ncbi:MAG TPA: hypothetical protein VGG79_19600 [Roseiarcus sp.]|jgi:hypothetical protein
MTYAVPRTSTLALGVAALVSLSTLSVARADPSAEPAPTPSVTAPAHPTSMPTPAPTTTAAAPSLNAPAPTPAWAEAGPHAAPGAHNPGVRHYAHRHYAYARQGRRDYSGNPIGTVAMRVAGGAADLGSVAAYPFYCFPNYGSCSVRVPYRY